MKKDMDIQLRLGVNHQRPDALSRLPIEDAPGADVDDSFPDESSTRTIYRGHHTPVL